MIVSFDVQGTPKPKGSTTRMPNGVMLPAGTTKSRNETALWRTDIREAAKSEMEGAPPMAGAIRLEVEFRLAVPRSMAKRYIGWLPHTKRPDQDKLFRMLGDALTGIVWVDDSQVCYSMINKVYAWDGITGASVTAVEYDEAMSRDLASYTGKIREAIKVADWDDSEHSRACTWEIHQHGSNCAGDCPTCHGKAVA